LNLAASVVGLKEGARIQRPGALHRARWMAKAIYSLKIELLSEGNESVLQLTARELKGIKRFNRFIVCIYMQSWFSCRFAADAPINDISLINRLHDYDDLELQRHLIKLSQRTKSRSSTCCKLSRNTENTFSNATVAV
jgi:hypothetical protein